MERDYLKQPAAEFRTPRMHALSVPDKSLIIQTWACSPDNTIDQDRWFYCVELHHMPVDDEERVIERHYYGSLGEALRYRYDRAGINEPFIILDAKQSMAEFLNNVAPEKVITRVDFVDVPLWEGYTLQEILNIRA